MYNSIKASQQIWNTPARLGCEQEEPRAVYVYNDRPTQHEGGLPTNLPNASFELYNLPYWAVSNVTLFV